MRFLSFAVLTALLFSLLGCSGNESSKSDANAQQAHVELNLKVYKSPTCGCCGEWVEHVKKSGFDTDVEDLDSLNEIKQQYGVAPKLQSCHTAVSKEGYIFEGHIPAKTIKAFLQNPPENALGLTVPGMPVGSPGMEVGERFDPYQVLLIKSDGTTEVFAVMAKPEDQF